MSLELHLSQGQLGLTTDTYLEFIEIKMAGKPVVLGQPFDADESWLKGMTLRVKNLSDKPIVAFGVGGGLISGMSLVEPETYPGIRPDYEHSLRTLRSLPADIFISPDANEFGMWRKLRERATANDPAEPFIDRDGYLSYIDHWEERFRELLASQQQAPQPSL